MKQEPELIEIGKKIKAVRNFRGISLAKLSAMTHLGSSNFSPYENGHKNARILTLKEIARCLDIDVKVFL